MRVQTIVSEIETILQNNISDVNPYRSSDWIYTDFPRLDATKPRIGIEFVDDSREWLSINSYKKVISARIQVTVLVDTTNKFDIDDDGTPEKAEQVLDYLADEVENVIRNNQTQLRNLGNVYWVLPESSTQQSPGQDVKQKNIDFIATFVR